MRILLISALLLQSCAVNPLGGIMYLASTEGACARCETTCGDKYLDGFVDTTKYEGYKNCCKQCIACKRAVAEGTRTYNFD